MPRAVPGDHGPDLAKMVSGIDVLVLRPDEELRRLARLAVELGVSEQVASAANEDGLVASLAGSDAGDRWLADFELTKDPWFYFSCGTGVFHHHHRSWIDDTRLPVQTIGSYIARLDAGEDISRPHGDALAERERITEGHRALLPPELCEAFDESLALARTVFPYVENHHFYIDHRYFTIFWNKVREFGALLARHGFLADGEDVFLLRHDEVRSALEELRLDWSSGRAGVPHGPLVWPPLVERRRAVYDAMCAWAQPPALGPLNEEITDPISIMLWGITDERVRDWLSSDGDGAETLTGCPASARGRRGPGARAAADGPARRARGRRDPRRAGHLTKLDTGLPPDRRSRPRHRWNHVPRGDRRPRIPAAGSRRNRHRDEKDQVGRPAARRCHHRGRDHPRTSAGVSPATGTTPLRDPLTHASNPIGLRKCVSERPSVQASGVLGRSSRRGGTDFAGSRSWRRSGDLPAPSWHITPAGSTLRRR